MRTKIILACCIIASSIILSVIGQKKECPSQLILENVEVLSNNGDEPNDGVGQKWDELEDEGEFVDNYGFKFHIIHKHVDCFGEGSIECTPHCSRTIKY